MTSPTPQATRTGPLAPYRVLDLADEKGQLAARLLAQLGADVIKVETPRRGDRTRANGPFYRDEPGPENSLFWWTMNAGKRSVTCALQVATGRELFHKLVAVSDVVIETNEPGTQAALGLDYETLRHVNPRIIVVSITSWGQSGPNADAKYRSNDLVASAMGGLMHFTQGDDEAPPVRTTMPQTYVHVNTRAAAEAVTALYVRGDTGAGQHVEVSLEAVVASLAARTVPPDSSVGRRMFPAADGMVVTPPLGGLTGPAGPALIDWLAENGSGGDLATPLWRSRLSSEAELPPGDRATVESVLERFCATRPCDWLVSEAQRRGAAWTPLYGPGRAIDNPQLREGDPWPAIANETDGESFVHPPPPWTFDGRRDAAAMRVPRIGEHNAEIYTGLLGVPQADIRHLGMRMVV
jgi:crotonobetainyl-CoA:carnitine CoA-transferase CaiB-like acyl-CoA transferase